MAKGKKLNRPQQKAKARRKCPMDPVPAPNELIIEPTEREEQTIIVPPAAASSSSSSSKKEELLPKTSAADKARATSLPKTTTAAAANISTSTTTIPTNTTQSLLRKITNLPTFRPGLAKLHQIDEAFGVRNRDEAKPALPFTLSVALRILTLLLTPVLGSAVLTYALRATNMYLRTHGHAIDSYPALLLKLIFGGGVVFVVLCLMLGCLLELMVFCYHRMFGIILTSREESRGRSVGSRALHG